MFIRNTRLPPNYTVTSQKIVLFIVTAVRNSYPAKEFFKGFGLTCIFNLAIRHYRHCDKRILNHVNLLLLNFVMFPCIFFLSEVR
jgi:hypothetical protein